MLNQSIKSGYAFVRNPIICREDYPWGPSYAPVGGKYYVNLGGNRIYEGRFYPPLDVDLSEILDAYSSFFAEPIESDQPVSMIESSDALESRDCNVIFEFVEDGRETTMEFTAIPGGISSQNFKRMLSTDQDIFSARFFNSSCNFFLTTRTAGWRLCLKETELYPLYFIAPEEVEINVVELVSKSTLNLGSFSKGVYALDINAIRKRFVESNDVLPNIFDIYMSGNYSCRIVVESASSAKERYRLKFRNSLGVLEIIEIVGSLTISPDYPDAEDGNYDRFDYNSGYFSADRSRIERRESISIDTGFKRSDEIRHLMDMIASEEVYLLDFTSLPLKVIPSVEDFSYSPRPDSPESISLKLDIADSEINIMQEIIDGSEGRKPRVFSKQFSKQFN